MDDSEKQEGIIHTVVCVEKRGTCAWCEKEGSKIRGDCSRICTGCSVVEGKHIYLHSNQKNCFAKYHGVSPDKFISDHK